jgi:tRNA-specific 2-thiouridylase
VIALSGGVDSAVAAARLLDDGAAPVGVHLRTGVESEAAATGGSRSCCGADDARDARAVAAHLGIPFFVVDVSEAFETVLEGFASAYARGRTPNPCVECNRFVKFGRLAEVARSLSAEAVATGHYARTGRAPDGRRRLLPGRDPRKDQSYVLATLTQEQLAFARFPLGDATKDEVREEARRRGLPVAEKRDSQELCFVPDGDHRRWLRERTPEAFVPGTVEDEEGRALAPHDGATGFTVGQRRGLPPMGAPRFVARVDPAAGRIVVAPRERLSRRLVRIRDANWIEVPEPAVGTVSAVRARIRHAAPAEPARLTATGGGTAEVEFEAPAFAPAPGQLLVAYGDEGVLCAGVIESSA